VNVISSFEIRGATIDDLPRIVEIYNASIPGRMATADTESVSVEQRTSWFRSHTEDRRPIWVLVTGGGIAAWGSLSDFYGRPAYAKTAEASVYVAPEHQGKGYGSSLFRHMIKCCPELGIETLLGFVFAHNAPSRTMQEELGFEQWGCLPQVAVLDGVERDLLIVGLRVSQ
jgi:L-amino acid N-acyltransferase YncA